MSKYSEALGLDSRASAAGIGAIGNSPPDFNLDPYAGFYYQRAPGSPLKQIYNLTQVVNQIDSGYHLTVPSNGVITYGFYTGNHAVGINNNPHSGEGQGYSPFSDAQKAAAVQAIGFWDDLVPLTFQNVGDVSTSDWARNKATILLQNTTTGPAQAWTYYPGDNHQYARVSSDVWTDTPSDNWTNDWFGMGGYGNTTLIHELGHAIGLSHPGAYNYDPNLDLTYDNYAEYAQDSMQYSIMSYWSGSSTRALTINWSVFLNNYAQTPMLHDILTIQSIYGADMTTRTGDTVYGFNSNAGKDVFDFNKNPFPYLSIYDAGGNDTIDLSGFTASQFVDLHPGAFSSIGAAIPDAATINANTDAFNGQYGTDFGHLDQGTVGATGAAYMGAAAARIAAYTGVSGINATEYDNFSIAYGVTIENATGGSARDLLWGNEVANTLKGLAGNDVLNGFGGNDRLIGGTGDDRLTGGAGDDLFIFANDGSIDTVTDFQTGHDKIDLSGVDGATAAYVQYDAVHHQVTIDTNHDGTVDMFINLLGNNPVAGDYIFHA